MMSYLGLIDLLESLQEENKRLIGLITKLKRDDAQNLFEKYKANREEIKEIKSLLRKEFTVEGDSYENLRYTFVIQRDALYVMEEGTFRLHDINIPRSILVEVVKWLKEMGFLEVQNDL